MTTLIVAEKPSVARDIAKVLGAGERGQGFLHGGGYKVTWAIGHLVALAQPAEVNPAWKRWNAAQLPMLPEQWPLKVLPKTRKQFTVVKRLLRARDIKQVVCATDAGREGELIFRYIYEEAGSKKPVSRLWISSLTPAAIRAGLAKLRPASAYDALADAARGRSRADWLVGMNLSRAYTLAHDDKYSVGRVQTPTLSLVVDRERAIRNFTPETYLEVVATFHPSDGTPSDAYKATYYDPDKQPGKTPAKPAAKDPAAAKPENKSTRLPNDGIEAAAIMGRARTGAATLASLRHNNRTIPPPRLYDLTELQRDANRMFGMRASQTLKAAQALYERHKLISYPRTDSRHLSGEVAGTLGPVVKAIAGRYPGLVADGSGTRPLGKRFVDDSKVSDHHAIIPLASRKKGPEGETPEGKIYDLICRRLLAAWHPDHRFATTTAIVKIHQPPAGGRVDLDDTSKSQAAPVDHYRATGKTVTEVGWKVLDRVSTRRAKAPEQNLVANLREGSPQTLVDIKPENKTTRPPPPLNEATLLTAMETAGRTLEDRELSDAMRERGLGTPATRAAIIETLLARTYIERKGKALHATSKGERLIDLVHPNVRSPEMTGSWEHQLKQVERGALPLGRFMEGICGFVSEVVEDVKTGRKPSLPARSQAGAATRQATRAPPTTTTEPANSRGRPAPAMAPAPKHRSRRTAPTANEAARTNSRRAAPQNPARPREAVRRPTPNAQTSLFSGTAFEPPAEPLSHRRTTPSGPSNSRGKPSVTSRRAAPKPSSGPDFSRPEPPAYLDGPPPSMSHNPYLDDLPPSANHVAAARAGSDDLDSFDPGAPPEWLAFAPPGESMGPPPEVFNDQEPPAFDPGPALEARAQTRAPFSGPPPTPSRGSDLGELLHKTFKHENFRPHQETICRAITDAKDVLVVMPTGAGKSLCYQLPGLARGGTTLVVSPLIALMDDQVGKLQALGLRAERIHSGLERGAGSQIYRDYLSGNLEYLFVAPERLGIPGFVDMLSRRLPSLIAVDEAHCISQWGHDFRPDYRMLGERLPALRPAPIVALTATATPRVQDDIVTQLGLRKAQRFILGFRRTNIAVEVVDLPPRARSGVIGELFAKPNRLPAIVYASTRKQSEEIAADLAGSCKIAAYHAGMPGAHREKIQARFLGGKLDAIVATVAFGMGIDKANVRTVIHAALPGTVEGYYQEIGRAGRDGKPSRAVLMHSYADRRTHEYFTERDYPEPDDLQIIYDAVVRRPLARSTLAKRTGFKADELDRMLDKLRIHGGVRYEPDDRVSAGTTKWLRPYSLQRNHRHEQLEHICQFAASTSCRMLRLVEHFGDQADSGEPCGCCDVCAPSECMTRTARAANDDEQELMAKILEKLEDRRDLAVGRLFRDHFEPDLSRREFETLLAALATNELVKIVSDSFKKGSRTIAYRKASLTLKGRQQLSAPGKALSGAIQVSERPATKSRPRKRSGTRNKSGSGSKSGASKSPALTCVDQGLAEKIRTWRLQTARDKGIGAHRILTNKALEGVAAAKPTTTAQLLEVSGIGPTTAKKYGKELLRLVAKGS